MREQNHRKQNAEQRIHGVFGLDAGDARGGGVQLQRGTVEGKIETLAGMRTFLRIEVNGEAVFQRMAEGGIAGGGLLLESVFAEK